MRAGCHPILICSCDKARGHKPSKREWLIGIIPIEWLWFAQFLCNRGKVTGKWDCRQLQEVRKHGISMLGQNGFRMELDPDDRPGGMLESHEHAVGRASGDKQFRGKCLFDDDERMIATNRHGIRNAGKDALPRVMDLARPSVPRLRRADNVCSEGSSNDLMSQADSEQRDLSPEFAHDLEGATCVLRRARARGDDERCRLQLSNSLRMDGVAPDDLRLLPQAAQIASQVVNEAVVVVEEQDHGRSALTKPVALCQVSSYSCRGSDWATMPPPTGSCHQPRPAVMVRIRIFKSSVPSNPR